MPEVFTSRYLLITADDFGIGPETSRGILELAARRSITSSVLLSNSVYAAECVGMWRRSGARLELGWHPALTLDRPILPPGKVPSLVDGEGRFPALGQFLKRLITGRIRQSEVEAEYRAQLHRFIDLVGFPPVNVNAHHHLHVFAPIGAALRTVLSEVNPKPFMRSVVEPRKTIFHVRGARIKRAMLTRFGRRSAIHQRAAGHVGTDWLVGITDPPFVRNPSFFHDWIKRVPGQFVELTCHPGYLDTAVEGRDGSFHDGQLQRRQFELELLRDPSLPPAIQRAGFQLVTAAEMRQLRSGVAPVEARRMAC